MKKILLILLLLITGCAYYVDIDSRILKPTNNPIQSKLPSMIIGLGEDNITRNEAFKSIAIQHMFSTIINREIEQNIIKDSREKYGYIEIVISYFSFNSPKYLITDNESTYMLAHILGADKSWDDDDYLDIEMEFILYDSKKIQVKKYIISEEIKISDYCTAANIHRNILTNNILNEFKDLDYKKSVAGNKKKPIEFDEIEEIRNYSRTGINSKTKRVIISNPDEKGCDDLLVIYAVRNVVKKFKDKVINDYDYITTEMINSGKIESLN